MTLVISFALLLLAPQEALIRGLEQFHRGEYLAAQESLRAAGDAPRARVFLALARAATGECEAVSKELLGEARTQTDAELKRAAGIGYVQCALAKDRTAEALPVLQELLAAFPDDADVLYLSARLYMKGWNDTVYAMYQKTPSSFRVNQVSAEVFEMQGRYAEAEAEYRKAIGKSGAALNLHFRLGRVLVLESKFPEAQAEFEAELKLNPRDAVAEYQVGQLLLARGDRDAAEAHVAKALSLDSQFVEAAIALGKLRVDQKRFPEAVELLERAVKLNPKSETAHYNLMLAYRNAGRADDARRESKELEKLQKPPEGEFTEFLKKLGEKPAKP
ncbi:MAG: tetratricopeptide repeat protein [Bryobacteraceae bacterium]